MSHDVYYTRTNGNAQLQCPEKHKATHMRELGRKNGSC